MKPISKKTGFFTLTLAAVGGGMLLGVSSVASNQLKTYTSNALIAQGMMDHGSMGDMSMDLGPSDANYDLRFIDGMIMHHQGAIDMAQEALTKSQRPEMKKLAQDIITAQNQEIAEMKQWRQQWYAKAGEMPMAWSSKMNHMMPMTSQMMESMMMSVDLGAADSDFDLRFINAMIPHHEGALIMAEDALNKSSRPEIKKLSQDILASQTQEIEQMEGWRKAWYN